MRGKLSQNHLLAEYTSWKIGGPAEYFYEPADLEDLKLFLKQWQGQPLTILGAASNVLIRDQGIKGAVVYLRNHLNKITELDEFRLRVEAGVAISFLLQKCIHLGMTDAVFMTGIPGTVGGALAMNAGTAQDCMWNHVESVETINRLGETKERSAKEFTVNYRQITGLDKDEWFVAATLVFSRGDIQEMKKELEKRLQKRKISQPLDLPSCGSVFRNPPGDYAARLIEACGFKGKQIGGARVSEKHANFIVNSGGAKASDVEALMQEIVAAVKKRHNVNLIPEVHVLGEQ